MATPNAIALLADVRVLEVATGVAGAYCGRTLADLGATVTKVEPPEGDALRHAGPFVGGVAHAERSTPFLWLNAGKRSVTLRLDVPADVARLRALAIASDVLVLDSGADALASAGIAEAELRAAAPGLVVVRISPFGESGPHAGWHSSALVQYAMACWMHMTGRPDREPLASGGLLSELAPGLAAACAALMALHARDAAGAPGQHVEIAQQEMLALMQPYVTLGLAYTGAWRPRTGMPFPMTLVEAADGWLGVNVLTQSQWELLCAFSGETDLLADERFATPLQRSAHAAELTERFARWAATRPRLETFVEGQGWRVPLGFAAEIPELSGLAQHQARGFFVDVEHPETGTLRYPRAPVLGRGVPPLRRAPLLGEHTDDADPPPAPRPPHPAARTGTPECVGERAGPLADVRIVDLSMWWAGPFVTELCALMGAEVIKVESIQRVDGWRGGRRPDGEPPEYSHVFNGVNLNKQGITLDLSSERGRALLRRLVARADALVENYSPRVMENLGLTDAVLFEWNPNLIALSMPAFGLTGPWRDFVGFAPPIEQVSGLCALTGYEGGPPVLSGHSVADPAAGLNGTLALLAALRDRDRRGGGGQHIDVSQLEAMTALLGDAVLAWQATGEAPARHGNAEPGAAPSGAYPSAGDDRWLVLSVPDDAAWTALCAVIGQPAFSADARFATREARLARRAELDAIVSAWTCTRDAAAMAEALRAAGVAAAPVYNPVELLADPHLNARGYFIGLDRDFVGRNPYPGLPFRFSGTPAAVRHASPTLGQYNREVLGGILGLSDAELETLEAEHVIGTRPL